MEDTAPAPTGTSDDADKVDWVDKAVEVLAAVPVFDSSAESVAQARRLVVRQLDDWGVPELADDARLVVSELLSNAALHAEPPIRMRLARLPAGVRVEVSDGSKEMPLLVRAGTDEMTGRGWTLVEALCYDWGVHPIDRGKVVWATLSEPDTVSVEAGPHHPARSHTVDADLIDLAEPAPARDEATRYEVNLGDVPTDLLVSAKAHVDALIREFALLASGAVTGTRPVPRELTTLIERVVDNFSEARHSIKKQALQAADQRQRRTQLSLYLPLSAAAAGLAYLAALDEVDAYCRAERMLTLETPPVHRVFRVWCVEELVAGLRRAADPRSPEWARKPESFESRLLHEYQSLSATFTD